MRFGKSAAEAAVEPPRSGGGGDWIKYLRDGDTTFRILQDPDDWTWYWEHFSPAGFSFPCSNEDDCYGCVSDNEKMKKVSRKIAFNVLESFNGQDYVAVYKVNATLGDKLKNRYARFGTLVDRDYTFTKFKTSGDRVDYDLEGGTPTPVDLARYELRDIEQMLAASWDEAWGTPAQAQANRNSTAQASRETEVAQKVRSLQVAREVPLEDPPSEPAAQRAEPTEVREEDLRRMPPDDLRVLCKEQGIDQIPGDLESADQIVDWLLETQA